MSLSNSFVIAFFFFLQDFAQWVALCSKDPRLSKNSSRLLKTTNPIFLLVTHSVSLSTQNAIRGRYHLQRGRWYQYRTMHEVKSNSYFSLLSRVGACWNVLQVQGQNYTSYGMSLLYNSLFEALIWIIMAIYLSNISECLERSPVHPL